MLVGVDFEGQSAQFEMEAERLIGQWRGPVTQATRSVRDRVREALERPRDYPPLRQSVVPGDRVTIPLDPEAPELSEVLAGACDVLREAGVEASAITVLAARAPSSQAFEVPNGVNFEVHDPDDRSRIAYLASTSTGRRVYLDRLLTDADVVVPIGVLAHGGEGLPYRGPWSAIYPDASDRDTLVRFRGVENPATREANAKVPDRLAESAEVSWLLGSMFHIGIEIGLSGVAGIIAGAEETVRRNGVESIEADWTMRIDQPADLALVGIGVPWKPTTLDDLAQGIETAARSTRVGGKVVAFSRVAGTPGRAIRRLAELDDPRAGVRALRGMDREEDYSAAVRLATALARADVYLFSDLDPEIVEGIGMIPLDSPSNARRLVETSGPCVVLSPGEWMRAVVEDD